MAIFSKCEVSDGPHGKQVVATAPVDPGAALVVDEEVIFAVECPAHAVALRALLLYV